MLTVGNTAPVMDLSSDDGSRVQILTRRVAPLLFSPKT